MQGDILFLHMSKDPIRAGEIVVSNVDVSFFWSVIFYSACVHYDIGVVYIISDKILLVNSLGF